MTVNVYMYAFKKGVTVADVERDDQIVEDGVRGADHGEKDEVTS